MCIRTIIDASMFGNLDNDSCKPIRKWIERRDGMLIYPSSGQYREELIKSPKVLRWFQALRQQGSAEVIRDKDLNDAKRSLIDHRLLSNDRHVIALALASGALVLCTHDQNLKTDFLNRDLLPRVGDNNRAVDPEGSKSAVQKRFVDRRQCPNRRRR